LRAIVTGGAGFLGRFVVDRLRQENIEVLSCDIVAPQEGKRLDVTSTADVDALLASTRPELVVHLAAATGSSGKGGGAESMKNPFDYLRANIMGTLNIFESCRRNRVAKVIYMSSFSPYGATGRALTEDTPLNPSNPYGASKACAETIAKCYALNYGIKTIVFRAPLLCGEGQRELNALREFAMSVRRGEPIAILGEGKHVREWVHPSDAADAFARAIPYFERMETNFETFVLGNSPVSMKDLANLVIKATGKNVRVERRESTMQVFDQFTDTSKVRRALGWQPRISVEQIVQRVVADVFDKS